MTWLAIRLFMGKALERLLTAFRWMIAHPREALLIAAVLALFWQNRAIHSARAERDAARHEVAAMIEASKANRAAAERQAKEQQAKLDAATKDAQDAYQDGLAQSRDATARYVASHRLRKDCGISPAASPAQGSDPSLPTQVPADPPSVAISETDLQALIDWLQIGVAAHNQAVEKIQSGAAMPDPAFGH